MKKDDLDFEEFIRMEAEKEGKELKKHEYNGNIYYTIGEPDIDKLVRTALRLIEK